LIYFFAAFAEKGIVFVFCKSDFMP